MLRTIVWIILLSIALGAVRPAMPSDDQAQQLVDHQKGLVPDTSVQAPVLEFDFPGLSIGIAEYPEGPTGTTVFRFDKPAMAAVDVRGGAPGTIETDGLRLGYDDWGIHAISLSGGSAYGLAAATGVTEAIKERVSDPGNWQNIVGVSGAIIFDLGGRRFNAITPDYALGKAALAAAIPGRFPMGAQGAGRFAMQGWFIGDPQYSGQGLSANTTISLLVTNQKMPFWALQRLAVQVHTSMARAIQPFSTSGDGDTLFAVTTNEVENDDLPFDELGAIASEVAWDAVLASVPPLPPRTPLPTTPMKVSSDQLDKLVGAYELSPWARVDITREGDRLLARGPEQWNLYFPREQKAILIPISDNEFLIEAERSRISGNRGDRIFFEDNAGVVAGFVINPEG
jgi:L-aminopeptidase/D-esterase-like protein